MTKTYLATHNGNNFNLPRTNKCRVIYTKDGARYGRVMTTPVSRDALHVNMLSLHVSLSQIERVEAV